MASMRKVAVVGNSGSGKTTLAKALAERLGVPHLELDSVQHMAGWQERPLPRFREIVADYVATPGWVIDGNYAKVRDLVWSAADAIVWLDPPRWQAMRQVVPRTLRRMLTREELWNGNREHLSGLLSTKPAESIILWAWTAHSGVRAKYVAAMADPQWASAQFIRLCTRAEAREFLAAVSPARGGPGLTD